MATPSQVNGRRRIDRKPSPSDPLACGYTLANILPPAIGQTLFGQPILAWGWLRAVPGGEDRASISADVNAEGLSLISMKVREKATAARQMAPAIIAPTTSPRV